jgi:RNA polymerase sigma-70 factor (ECF subfamily)
MTQSNIVNTAVATSRDESESSNPIPASFEAFEAFEAFVAATRPQLRQRMLAMTGGRTEDAEDLVAETYARAWERWDTLRDYNHPDAWLGTVAWRLAAHLWRRRRRRGDLLARWSADLSSWAGPWTAPDVDGVAVDRVSVAAAIRSLPAAQRDVLHAHYWEDVPVVTIATRLGIAPGSVKARLFRGRAALAALLADLPEGATGTDG